MFTVQIAHPIKNYDAWRAAFERDPAGREAAGVRRYRILRPVDDPWFVIIDLDFDSNAKAQAFVATMQKIWTKVEGTVITDPRARVAECVEQKEY